MPSILSRFRRSPSSTSTNERRVSTISTSDDEEDLAPGPRSSTSAASYNPVAGGSVFVEELNSVNRIKGDVHPNHKQRQKPPPLPLSVPTSVPRTQAPTTPRLVLTTDGSNSPISFKDSPLLSHEPGVKLGLPVQVSATGDMTDPSHRRRTTRTTQTFLVRLRVSSRINATLRYLPAWLYKATCPSQVEIVLVLSLPRRLRPMITSIINDHTY
jgi:hypothetical protein